ncbi:MAG: phosphatidylserine/phosphatidylglycerophosphate/cardiolipin synthase family protein [Acidobacteria bacterium]|nr:phosphatidylserine/phosphatidylglycerophosphate/cardiolipin synthase family protein [Acidobacteriota bacterium]MBW4044415.1 phosphatidylserine/phosphatidylglycerophosphate/cardiolipin synthase family protein [Acidobacteriota bacterium]
MNRKAAGSAMTKTLAALGAGALVLQGVRLGMEVFGPSRPYHLESCELPPIDSPEFLGRIACVTDAALYRDGRFTVLRNGAIFYPAELAAIDQAKHAINLQAYEFQEGDFTRELLRRLTACARRGIQVRVLIDFIGSYKLGRDYFRGLTEAGGHFAWYHPIDLKQWPYFDHRSHRKLLTIDGSTGFIGGADYADHWIECEQGKLPWRDTVFKVEGGLVSALNATFSQNWVESTGEILFSSDHFPAQASAGETTGMVVMGRPGYGTSSVRVLFQALLDSARSSIKITTPYFLPDRSARHALMRAAGRGVNVEILTAGRDTDHASVRRLSEAMSVKLIRSGVAIYEYQPSMIHAKLMTVDGVWSICGSTNFDHRSFSLNDEVNLAIRDRAITETLEEQFQEDLARSRRVTRETLRRQGISGKIFADVGWVLRREE